MMGKWNNNTDWRTRVSFCVCVVCVCVRFCRYDLRSSRRCCSWRVSDSVLGSPADSVACTGLEIDEWKLLCGFKGTGSGIGLYVNATLST